MFENVKGDIEIYRLEYAEYGVLKQVFYLLFRQELYAVLIYRFGRWVHVECKIPVLKSLLNLAYFFLNKAGEMLVSVFIWPYSEIGPGLKIEHLGGVVIGPKKMGRNCRVSQHVTIGFIGGFKGGGLPTIGNNVYVGAGAKILGQISIGNNAKIGANAVVLCDVPDFGVAVGVPAKVLIPKDKTEKGELP